MSGDVTKMFAKLVNVGDWQRSSGKGGSARAMTSTRTSSGRRRGMKYWPSHRSDTFVLVDDPRYRVVEKDGRRAITCKRCGRTSHNPTDVRNVYCGNCHRFLLDPPPAEVATPH
jgi:hypothetical protein